MCFFVCILVLCNHVAFPRSVFFFHTLSLLSYSVYSEINEKEAANVAYSRTPKQYIHTISYRLGEEFRERNVRACVTHTHTHTERSDYLSLIVVVLLGACSLILQRERFLFLPHTHGIERSAQKKNLGNEFQA